MEGRLPVNAPEIKAGQWWVGIGQGNSDKTAKVEHVTETDVFYVVFRAGIRAFSDGAKIEAFIGHHRPMPVPKTRTITADDIMEMLAVNPVLWRRLMSSATIFGDWELMTSTQFFPFAQYSRNPFAANPVIHGPEIEVKE